VVVWFRGVQCTIGVPWRQHRCDELRLRLVEGDGGAGGLVEGDCGVGGLVAGYGCGDCLVVGDGCGNGLVVGKAAATAWSWAMVNDMVTFLKGAEVKASPCMAGEDSATVGVMGNETPGGAFSADLGTCLGAL